MRVQSGTELRERLRRSMSRSKGDQVQHGMDVGKHASVFGHIVQLPMQAFDRTGDVDQPQERDPVGEVHREPSTRRPREMSSSVLPWLSRWDVEIARTLIHKICYRFLVPIRRTF